MSNLNNRSYVPRPVAQTVLNPRRAGSDITVPGQQLWVMQDTFDGAIEDVFYAGEATSINVGTPGGNYRIEGYFSTSGGVAGLYWQQVITSGTPSGSSGLPQSGLGLSAYLASSDLFNLGPSTVIPSALRSGSILVEAIVGAFVHHNDAHVNLFLQGNSNGYVGEYQIVAGTWTARINNNGSFTTTAGVPALGAGDILLFWRDANGDLNLSRNGTTLVTVAEQTPGMTIYDCYAALTRDNMTIGGTHAAPTFTPISPGDMSFDYVKFQAPVI